MFVHDVTFLLAWDGPQGIDAKLVTWWSKDRALLEKKLNTYIEEVQKRGDRISQIQYSWRDWYEPYLEKFTEIKE